ncbi:MAG: 16S rRNA (uracil(1498)-N(3))-methyltransferase [Gammaproteobacteria bacterium]|nr:16S rRNA (uracil(1498)-N(3))-methyltransferase [Gammaproteobacteria bacterium]
MRSSRIYFAEKLTSANLIDLDGEVAHYLLRVLRLKTGDGFSLFNSSDGEYCAEIISIQRSQLTAKINEPVINKADPKLVINLGLGLSRGERMDYAIQKSTELGVGTITPLLTARSEVKLPQDRLDKKHQHWQKVAISACEQCGRNAIPTINAPATLEQWVAENSPGLVLDHRGTERIEQQKFDNAVSLLVGPEGGLSEEELQTARQNQFAVVKAGPRILRTETAPVVALSLVQYLFGDI